MKSVFVLLLLCGLAVSSTAASAQGPAVADTSAFSVGDAIRITVFGHTELSGEFEIGLDGAILSPLYRDIRVVGRTVSGAEDAVRPVLLRELSNPRFLVEPLFRVQISGQVGAPNTYTIAPQTDIVHALNLAGGPNENARVNRVRLVRGGREIYVDLTSPAAELAAVRLRSGDQILVDSKPNVWREYFSPVLSTAGSIASLAYLFLRVSGRL